MNYADYKRFDVINGPGIRHSLFVSGCTHHCRGCFNSSIWNFNSGKIYTQELEDQILADLNINYVKISGLSILGGEPFQNSNGLTPLVRRVKEETCNNNIWIWSGYTYEEIATVPEMYELLHHCDVLVDGKFELDQRDLTQKFKGSKNQRIIDVQKSLIHNKVFLWS